MSVSQPRRHRQVGPLGAMRTALLSALDSLSPKEVLQLQVRRLLPSCDFADLEWDSGDAIATKRSSQKALRKIVPVFSLNNGGSHQNPLRVIHRTLGNILPAEQKINPRSRDLSRQSMV